MSIWDYDWSLIWDNREALLGGLLTAFSVAIVALIISVAFGLLLAVLRSGRGPSAGSPPPTSTSSAGCPRWSA